MKSTMKCAFLFFMVALTTFLIAEPAWAWGPATHLFFGMNVLNRLSDLTASIQGVLSSQALPFLYGCVSADIVLAKKLGRAMTHCHKWENGIRLIEDAETPRIKAFSLGYVSHLAADTISHNCYVPSKTIESYDSGMLKHMYWELRFDKNVTNEKTLRLFSDIAKGDFTDCDEHLEHRVPTRLFDFAFNKRIFNQLLMLQQLKHWQKLWAGISKAATWPLKDKEIKHFTDRSMSAVMSFLNEQKDSKFVSADPIGQDRLKAAHELRRHYRSRLRNNNPPMRTTVRDAVSRFAREPFEEIAIDEHKNP
jgi:hypothetical protein